MSGFPRIQSAGPAARREILTHPQLPKWHGLVPSLASCPATSLLPRPVRRRRRTCRSLGWDNTHPPL